MMDLKSLKFGANVWTIIGTIAILALAYIFYFNYYIAGKENRIISTRFRVLDQIGDNLDKKLASYISNAENQRGKIENILNEIYERSSGKLGAYWYNTDGKFKFDEIEPNKLPSYIDDRIKNDDFNSALKVVDIVNNAKLDDIKGKPSKYNYTISVKIDISNLRIKSILKGDNIIIEAGFDNLMKGLDRTDVFDGLILIRDSEIIYNTLGQDMILTSVDSLKALIDPSKTNEKKKGSTNLSIATKNTLQQGSIFSGTAFDIVISNKPHKAFLKPIEVHDDTWYIMGLMERNNYNAASRSIAPWIIVTLSLLLIFIILGLPVIKLKVMSNTEELETGTIINFGLSMLLGGSLMILFVFFLIQNLTHNEEVDKHIADLSDEIYNSFTDEITKATDQLSIYDTSYNSIDFYNKNNRFENSIRINILDDTDPLVTPEKYYFADYYFWVDENGKQKAYMTPFDKYGSMSNLSSRDYVNKKDEWYFTKEDTIKFRLESIVSVTSGNVKGALSMPSTRYAIDTLPSDSFARGGSSDKIDSTKIPVIALSARFYSVIDPIIPKNYTFCIIDKSGKVWFHSDKNLNLKENFIAECDENKKLSAALYRNISSTINVDYYNTPHKIYIRPIDNLPLYLVTLYNINAEKSFQAQAITLTFILMGSLYFLIFIQVVGLLMIERRFQLPLTKNIIMKLTRPKMHFNENYKYLLNLNVIIFILIIPFILYLNNTHAIVAIFSLSIYSFSYMYWVLNSNPHKRKTRIWFTSFNIFLLFIVNFTGGQVVGWDGFTKVLAFQIAIIGTTVICHFFLKEKLNFGHKSYVHNFIISLLGVLIIFGIIPSLKFYEIAYNTEFEVRARHMQIDLMKQREKKNADIRKYYSLIKPSEKVDVIMKERKSLGNYTGFLNNTTFDSKTLWPDDDNKNNHWDSLISNLRPFYDDNIVENKYLIFNTQKNLALEWKRTDDDKLLFKYASLTEDPKQNKLMIQKMESDLPPMQFYLPFKGRDYAWWKIILLSLFFWIVVLGFLNIFFYLIRFGVRKIYCLDIIENYSHQSFIDHARHHLIACSNLMITRLSFVDETDDFREEFTKTYDAKYVNWSEMEEVKRTPELIKNSLKEFSQKWEDQSAELKEKKTIRNSLTIIIDHFDWNYNKPDVMSAKMDIVRSFIERDDILIVLISQSGADKITEHYQELIDQNQETENIDNSWLKINADFKNLLTKLVIVNQSVNYRRSYRDETPSSSASNVEFNAEGLIHEELSATDYLRRLKPAMMDYFKNDSQAVNYKNREENIIRRIDLLAQKYYQDLLDSCSLEEKYVLYDTADDLIVNPRNKNSILSLLEKGLLIKKIDRINFMNISFRRFVLNSLNKEETAEIEMKMGKASGSWKGYRITFIIIIIALFAFIAMANQNFFDNINELLVAIGGGLTVITSVLGVLSRKSKSSSE